MPSNTTFRIVLPHRTYSYVGIGKGHLFLKKTNSRRVKCGNCTEKIEPGAGVWYGLYGAGNYFVHIKCAKFLISKFGRKNYRESILGNLESGLNETGPFSAQQLCDGIQKFTFTTDFEGIQHLTPA